MRSTPVHLHTLRVVETSLISDENPTWRGHAQKRKENEKKYCREDRLKIHVRVPSHTVSQHDLDTCSATSDAAADGTHLT